jgi:uncharacterized LabA/DUF88 family protein
MSDDAYLFIDGGYLQTVYRDQFNAIFGGGYFVDYKSVMETFGCRRAFLYDCLDDLQKPGENTTDFDVRVRQQQDLFDEIDKVEGLHVRYGYLSPGRKRQQKEVDVLLAVDMLTHSFYKNMYEAVLLSGDRDFKPVVESIVRLGTRVKVAYDPRTGSRELARAADYEMEIDITALCRWIKLDKYEDRSKHFPSACLYQNQNEDPLNGMSPSPTSIRKGVIGQAKQALSLGDINKVWYASVQINPRDYSVYYFHDQAKLLAYLDKQCGEVVW